MAFSNDGFNERNIYIHNSNDRNRLNTNGPSNIDNSFAKMRVEERRNLVKTIDTNQSQIVEEARGSRENFLIRNNAMNNANAKPTQNNPIKSAMHNNLFNQFKKH